MDFQTVGKKKEKKKDLLPKVSRQKRGKIN